MEPRWIYIDFNSYFASCEQQAQPQLRGRPVAVVPVESDSSCAIAASYEAKKFGIKTGTPIWEAKKICPNLVCILARHDVYVSYHHRLLEEIKKHIPVTDVWSIDEVACRMMDNEVLRAVDIALAIKKGIRSNIGECLTSSIGIASNSYLAKVATELQKPDGLVVLTEGIKEKLCRLPLRGFPGIGYNMERRLHKHGVFSTTQLLELTPKQMRLIWGGIDGEEFWQRLNGIDTPRKQTNKSTVGHSHVMAPELRPRDQARIVAYRLTAKAASRLRRIGYYATSMDLSVRGENGEREGYGLRLPVTCDTRNFLDALDELWVNVTTPRIKKLGITFHGLTPQATQQLDFFGTPEKTKKMERLSLAIDDLNAKMGRDSVAWGVMPKSARAFSGTKIAFARIPDAEEFYE
jgi:DNA polymerase IV